MKKSKYILGTIIVTVALSVIVYIAQASVLVDSFETNNTNTPCLPSELYDRAIGQSFTGDGGDIIEAQFLIRRSGSPTGSIVANLYSHTGTFGSTGTPDSPLATSTSISVGDVGTSAGFYSFTFSTPYTTTDSTNYFVVLNCNGVSGSAGVNDIRYYYNGSGGHDGNRAVYSYGGTWSASSGDFDFRVYKADPVVDSRKILMIGKNTNFIETVHASQ